jgi:hypothetical protein
MRYLLNVSLLLCFILTFFQGLPRQLCAQIDIRIASASMAPASEDDLWNFTLTNRSNITQVVYIEVTIYDQEETVLYRAQNAGFKMDPSVTYNISRATINQIKIEKELSHNTDKKSAEQNTFLKEGSYSHCVSVGMMGTEIEVGRHCEMVTVKSTEVDSSTAYKSRKGILKKIGLHGSLQLFNYSDYKPFVNGPTINNRNSGFHLAPELNFFGIPVNGSIYYDTDTGFYYTSNTQMQLQLDVRNYQDILKERLKDYITNKVNLPLGDYEKYIAILKEKQSLTEIFQNESFIKEIFPSDQVSIVDSLQSKVKDAQMKFSNLTSRADSIKFNLDQCEFIDSAKCEYLKLQHSKLENTRDSLQRKIEAATIAVEKVKGYLKIIERKDEIDSLLMQDSTFAKVKSQYESVKDFDLNSLKDPKQIIQKLKESGKISSIENIFSHFKQLQLGVSVPEYSEFSMSGVTLNGLNAEYEFDKASVIFAGGKVHTNSFFYNPTLSSEDHSRLYAGGYRKKISPQAKYAVYLTHADFPTGDTATQAHMFDKNNALVGRFEYLFAEKITSEFEGALSFVKFRDQGFAEQFSVVPSPLSWLNDAIQQKDDLQNNSFTDLAAKISLKAKLFGDKTSIHLITQYVGTGFYSPGNPYLINDRFSNEAGIEQGLLKNRIQLLAAIILNQDNLSHTKATTTAFYNTRLSLILSFPKLPVLSLLYQPNVIVNNYDQIQVNSLSVTSSYRYRIKKLPCSATFGMMDMKTVSAVSETKPFKFRYVSAMHSVNMNGIDWQTGYNQSVNLNDSLALQYHSFSSGIGFTFLKSAELNLGIELAKVSQASIQPGGHFDVSFSISKIISIKGSIYSLPTEAATYSYLFDGYNPKASAYFITTFTF